MRARGTAIVEIDYVHPQSPFHYVMLDNSEAIAAGVEYLRELGHRAIAGVGLQESMTHPDERTDGFVRAVRQAGLPLPDPWNPKVARSGKSSPEEHAYHVVKRLLQREPRPTAVFALMGESGVGALRAVQDLGLIVPDQISVLGFDDDRWTTIVTPRLDVLEQPIEEMGRAAVRIVMDELEGHVQGTVRERYPARLLRRGSCRSPAT
jgi:LacI family transcriptional regulator